jgi:hypothetical protein
MKAIAKEICCRENSNERIKETGCFVEEMM